MGCFARGALHPCHTILLCTCRHKHCARPDNHSATSASPLETPAPPQTKNPPSLSVCSRLLRDSDPSHPNLHRQSSGNLHRQQEYCDLVLCGDQPGRELTFTVPSRPSKTDEMKMCRLSSPVFPPMGLCSNPSLPPSLHTETATRHVLTRLALFPKARGQGRLLRARRAISSLYMSLTGGRLLIFNPER